MSAHLDYLPNPERIVAWRLATGRIITREELIAALYGNRADGGPDDPNSVIDMYVWWLRRKLARHGVKIENGLRTRKRIETHSYVVRASDLERFRDLLADEIDRNVVIEPRRAAAAPAPEAAHG